jgi:hypothetical protein
MHIAHDCIVSNSIMCHTVLYQQFIVYIACAQIAKKIQYATMSDEPVILMDLWLTIHTLRVEKEPLLSLLSIESSPGSKEGGR